jgi:HTH-type transcriptional regulator / antitoxin HigA
MKTRRPREIESYLALIEGFPLRRLGNDHEHAAAMRMLHRLLVVEPQPLNRQQEVYLEALTVLVEDYERRSRPIERAKKDPIRLLKFLMNEQRMTVTQLGKLVGGQPTASIILSRKRALSKNHIRALAEYFQVDPGLFFEVERRTGAAA